MLSRKIQDALNTQLNLELASSYAYLAMTAWFEASALPGMAHWMRIQSDEERVHAMKLFDHLCDRGGKVVLQAIERQKAEWESPLAVFQAALANEQKVTRAINSLYVLAQKEGDYPSQVMLQWFINEQVEEERSATTAVEQLQMAKGAPSALLMLDQMFAARPAAAASAE